MNLELVFYSQLSGFDIIELFVTEIWLTCLPHWTCLSNFFDSLIICKRSSRGETIFLNIYFFVTLFLKIEILYKHKEFQFSKEKAAVLWKAMSKSSRSQVQWNFDEILKSVRSARCSSDPILYQKSIWLLPLHFIFVEKNLNSKF